ncbi:hypothetical protein CC80DRAFT_124538 [Byssothecium circinans]|uniref:F-box domain-containing protein n=1 Tax=Byssothecium circinans TaxID=147558 RepID=A0A6A5TN62_9PLEO|nr:hypothetical protein CC80DRAFT_124538 [Byssothecium circinans]
MGPAACMFLFKPPPPVALHFPLLDSRDPRASDEKVINSVWSGEAQERRPHRQGPTLDRNGTEPSGTVKYCSVQHPPDLSNVRKWISSSARKIADLPSRHKRNRAAKKALNIRAQHHHQANHIQSQAQNQLCRLPTELVLEVSSLLDDTDLLALRSTSRRLYDVLYKEPQGWGSERMCPAQRGLWYISRVSWEESIPDPSSLPKLPV